MKNKKYLVIGGAGFISSHLVDKLIQLKHRAIVLDNLSTGKKENINPRAKFVKKDIRNLKQISPFFKNIDGVFLLAALPRVQYSIDYPVETNRNNIEGILNVLIASQRANVKRIVYSSSSSIYGQPEKLPTKESSMPNPSSPYGLQKYAGEEYCRLFSTIHGLETVSLRYFNVYGPRMDDQSAYATVIAIFLKQIAKNQPLTITADGTQTRDFTYCSDVVRANILAMKSKKVGQGEAINIGGGKNYSINQITKMFSDKVKYIPSRIEPHDTLADISLAKKLLGWQPKVKLEEGIRKLLKE
jgi:nucleoside-diphosphate-sugar epimerase